MSWNEDFILNIQFVQFVGYAFVGGLSCFVIVKAKKNIFDIRIVIKTLKKHPIRNGSGCRIAVFFPIFLVH